MGAFKLLAPGEPPPCIEVGRQGQSNIVIAVDHASSRIPRRLGDLGLPASELLRHIAWDIGALDVGLKVAAELDAPLVAQNYSRLVIDCNRDPNVSSSIPTVGESIEIPGNIGLTEAEITARRVEIFDPVGDLIEAAPRGLDELLVDAGSLVVLVDELYLHVARVGQRNRDHRL